MLPPQLVDRPGPVQQVTLHKIDAEAAQALQHRRVVDKLGHGLQADQAGDVGKAAHSRLVQGVVDQVADELAVDLEEVHLQRLEVAEGRCPGAKVVQRHPHAQGPHLGDEFGGVGQVGDGGGLGHLQAQAGAQCGAGTLQLADGPAVEGAVADALARQVDAQHVQASGVGRVVHPGQHPPQHPAVDAGDQVEALGRRQEGARQD